MTTKREEARMTTKRPADPKPRRKRCSACDRREGDTSDRCGFPDPDGGALGPVERCPTCGRNACPDCAHENDCCFLRHDGTEKPPPGWRLAHVDPATGALTFHPKQWQPEPPPPLFPDPAPVEG
jgi:hypothetical protein